MKCWVMLLIVLLVGCTVEQGPIIQQTTSFPNSSTQTHGSPVEKENVVQKEVLKNNTTRPIENETRSEPTMQIYLDLIEDDSKNIEAEKFWDVYLPLYEGEYEVHIQSEDDTYADEALSCAQRKLSQTSFHEVVKEAFDTGLDFDSVAFELLRNGVDVKNEVNIVENTTTTANGNTVELLNVFENKAYIKINNQRDTARVDQEKNIGGVSFFVNAVYEPSKTINGWVGSCIFDAYKVNDSDIDVILGPDSYQFAEISDNTLPIYG